VELYLHSVTGKFLPLGKFDLFNVLCCYKTRQYTGCHNKGWEHLPLFWQEERYDNTAIHPCPTHPLPRPSLPTPGNATSRGVRDWIGSSDVATASLARWEMGAGAASIYLPAHFKT